MSFQFLLLIATQVTFVMGLGWFWLERLGARRFPRVGWLVAIIPVAAFGIGVMVGPELAVAGNVMLTLQDTIAFVSMWGCYLSGGAITLSAALQREAPKAPTSAAKRGTRHRRRPPAW